MLEAIVLLVLVFALANALGIPTLPALAACLVALLILVGALLLMEEFHE